MFSVLHLLTWSYADPHFCIDTVPRARKQDAGGILDTHRGDGSIMRGLQGDVGEVERPGSQAAVVPAAEAGAVVHCQHVHGSQMQLHDALHLPGVVVDLQQQGTQLTAGLKLSCLSARAAMRAADEEGGRLGALESLHDGQQCQLELLMLM